MNDQLCSTGLSWGANGGPAGQASAQGSLCGGSGCSCCHCCTVAGGPNEKRDLGRPEEEDVAGSPGAPCVTSMSRSASGAAPEPPSLAPVASGLWGRVRSCLASPRGCWVGHSSALGRCGFNQKNNLFASESDPDSFSQQCSRGPLGTQAAHPWLLSHPRAQALLPPSPSAFYLLQFR